MKHTQPHPFQAKGVRKIWHFGGRALLGDEMGLGKSFQSLLFHWQAKQAGKLRGPTIIVCPAVVKWNWQHEALLHFGLRSHVIEGRTPPKTFYAKYDLIIINYEILSKWLPVLKGLRPRLIIIDECQRISNRGTQQTKNTRKLCRRTKFVVALSGTPLLNRPAELYSVLNLLRPDKFNSWMAFAERYCKPERKPWGWQFKGAENLGHLHRRCNRWLLIRRRKRDVLKDLPDKTRSVVPITITNRREYQEAEADFIGWLTKKSAKLARKAAKAERLVRMGYLKRLAAELKLKSVMEWIDQFLEDTDEKLLVFAWHKRILRALHERYGKKSILLTGDTVGRMRQHVIDRFNSKRSVRLLLGNLQAAGVGWSCRSANASCHIELSWRPGDHNQAEDRTHGIGRGRKGHVSRAYYLVGRDTIEEDLCEVLQKKQRVLNETLDGDGRGDDLDIFDQLTEKLKRRRRKLWRK